MKKLIFILGVILIAGCTVNIDEYAESFEPMRVLGVLDTWESGVEGYASVSSIVTGGSEYYTCVLAPGAELPNGVSVGGYDGCEITGTITLNPGSSKLITPPFLMIVSDDYGNTLNVSVSLTVVENAPMALGKSFECVLGQACSKKLMDVYDGVEPYTYTLQLAGGQMPPGTAVGVDGYITGLPNHAGEYSFSVCVTDAENSQSCSYSYVNIVNDESELGQNPLYVSYEDEQEKLPKMKVTVNKAGSFPSHALMYIDSYENIENCTDEQCVGEFPEDSYIRIKATFLPDTYFAGWQGIECEMDLTDNYEDNTTECQFELTENVTITAVFNKRPSVHVTNFDCVFDRYHPNEGSAIYEDSKIWGYHHLIFSGTALTGTVGSILTIQAGGVINTEEGARSLDCGAWTKELVIDEYKCVRKATDPDSTTFSLTVNDFEPQGHLLPFSGYASIEENVQDVFIHASDNGSDACDYQ